METGEQNRVEQGLFVQTESETERLVSDERRESNWKRWGPYLSERQWGTVREDYSSSGNCWEYFSHDAARSRVYRWGEDGLLGITDRQCRLCFGLALWNEKDTILKERLYGLTGPEGNHGEDVKECYYYIDSTPTHSYMKGLYKYPQAEFPYGRLLHENRMREKSQPECELADLGVFDKNRYFDVFVEYAKAHADDLLIRITVANRGAEEAPIHVIPTWWFRNTWVWGRTGEGYWRKPEIKRVGRYGLKFEHESLGEHELQVNPTVQPEFLFTENETNYERLFQTPNASPFVKDSFHEYLIRKKKNAINPAEVGTKVGIHYRWEMPGGSEKIIEMRFSTQDHKQKNPFMSFNAVFDSRIKEANEFYSSKIPRSATPEEKNILRQGYAGLLWSKQFFHYDMKAWLDGDPTQMPPPEERKKGRNHEWKHLFNRDIISMPDKWEYPWYAAWDLAFHMIPFAKIDPQFAKEQLLLFMREWYMHPNGQIPAYEFAFGDVNPPVHAWAIWRVYKITGRSGMRDRVFLAQAFQKLLINFTWWVNRKDVAGKNLFSGGFLGLDNIGVFDRSRPLPTGGDLEQADGTAWMAFYCGTMLSIALELASEDIAYEGAASKFFEHFVSIVDAINNIGGYGLWDDEEGFYYDQIRNSSQSIPLKIRSMVGLIPLFAVEILETDVINHLPGFKKRVEWFLRNRRDLARHISFQEVDEESHDHRLLAIPSRDKLIRVLQYLLDENEFLSPYGVRALSKVHKNRPYIFKTGGEEFQVHYAPGESETTLFGGNSNWRGPVWFPVNYLLIEALERYHHFYGNALKVECPTGSGHFMTLDEVAENLTRRLVRLFISGPDGRRPCHGDDARYAHDPYWKDLILFYEYFHGDSGKGLGASHQTGWTALVVKCVEDLVLKRAVRE